MTMKVTWNRQRQILFAKIEHSGNKSVGRDRSISWSGWRAELLVSVGPPKPTYGLGSPVPEAMKSGGGFRFASTSNRWSDILVRGNFVTVRFLVPNCIQLLNSQKKTRCLGSASGGPVFIDGERWHVQANLWLKQEDRSVEIRLSSDGDLEFFGGCGKSPTVYKTIKYWDILEHRPTEHLPDLSALEGVDHEALQREDLLAERPQSVPISLLG